MMRSLITEIIKLNTDIKMHDFVSIPFLGKVLSKFSKNIVFISLKRSVQKDVF